MGEQLHDGADVLVVGAGPTGLVMASELARRGVSCRIVDTAPAPSDKSKALVVQARTLEVFEDMGVVEEAIACGRRMPGLNLFSDNRRIGQVHFDGLDSPYPFPLVLEQSETERILGKHLENLGLTIERRLELVGFEQDEEGVTATLRHLEGREEGVRPRWLIGCDGAHSTVRHTLGLPFKGTPYEEEFMLADVRVDWPLAEDEGHAFLFRGDVLVAIPMRGEKRYRLIASRSKSTQRGFEDPALVEFQAIVDECVPVDAELSEPAGNRRPSAGCTRRAPTQAPHSAASCSSKTRPTSFAMAVTACEIVASKTSAKVGHFWTGN